MKASIDDLVVAEDYGIRELAKLLFKRSFDDVDNLAAVR